jgi:hypothetical protein
MDKRNEQIGYNIDLPNGVVAFSRQAVNGIALVGERPIVLPINVLLQIAAEATLMTTGSAIFRRIQPTTQDTSRDKSIAFAQ